MKLTTILLAIALSINITQVSSSIAQESPACKPNEVLITLPWGWGCVTIDQARKMRLIK